MIKPENNIMTFKLLKENNCQPRIQLPPTIRLKNEGEAKVFKIVFVFYCCHCKSPQIWWHQQYQFVIILQFYR